MSIEDIKKRHRPLTPGDEMSPCTGCPDRLWTWCDAAKLVAKLEAVEEYAQQMHDSIINHPPVSCPWCRTLDILREEP